MNMLEGKFEYAFNITKVSQIFDYLLEDMKIWLLDGHKVPAPKEIKGKWYYKWNNS